MRQSFGLEMRHVQTQVLAPRMIQSMEILQLPLMALQERIDQEFQENPVLELKEAEPDSFDSTSQDSENPDFSNEEREMVVDENGGSEDFDRLQDLTESNPETFDEYTKPSANRLDELSSMKHDAISNMAARPQTLQDHLYGQLAWFEVSEEIRKMAEKIIYNLDSNGYLQGAIEDLLPPNADEQMLQTAKLGLAVVQQLEPAGVGARDLRECLLLQLTPSMPFGEQMKVLITDHLEDIKDNRLPLIERKTGYSLEVIQIAIEEIKELNPKPGSEYSESSAPPVIPEVFVELVEDGKYRVRLEDGFTPELTISKDYQDMIQKKAATGDAKDYLKKKINSAQWLIDSIQQRKNTLLKVSQAIVDFQTEFLDNGPEAIEPLKMQQIADVVGVHVTTVSRAVDSKWIQTPRGIFPLKRFFGGGTKTASGEEVAWDAIRIKLQEILDGEDKQKPYSDEELKEQLDKHGIKVARRTITKYRKAMNIPSSRQRREWSSDSKPAAKRKKSTKKKTAKAKTKPAKTEIVDSPKDQSAEIKENSDGIAIFSNPSEI